MCTVTVADVHQWQDEMRQLEADVQSAQAAVRDATDLPSQTEQLQAEHRRRVHTAWTGLAVTAALVTAAFVLVPLPADLVPLLVLAAGVGLPIMWFSWAQSNRDAMDETADRLRYLEANAEELANDGQRQLVHDLVDEADGEPTELHNLLVAAIWQTRRAKASTKVCAAA